MYRIIKNKAIISKNIFKNIKKHIDFQIEF